MLSESLIAIIHSLSGRKPKRLNGPQRLSSLRPFVVGAYVPREGPDVVGNVARKGVRHGTREWGLRADNDTGLTA